MDAPGASSHVLHGSDAVLVNSSGREEGEVLAIEESLHRDEVEREADVAVTIAPEPGQPGTETTISADYWRPGTDCAGRNGLVCRFGGSHNWGRAT